ncbi:hypothetical protein [Cytobacillus sp. FSL H8-0458]|uniref:hypothetical protein n=1 Tax=Cytobacillus sp. FSL H8-0458 TaxID=2975346 RepID=UPI0030F96E76
MSPKLVQVQTQEEENTGFESEARAASNKKGETEDQNPKGGYMKSKIRLQLLSTSSSGS